MIVTTICAANHLPKAACLARSLQETNAARSIVLCLVERDRSVADGFAPWFREIVLAAEIGITDFDSFIFRHNRYEACCAVKAQFLLWVMQRFPDERDFLYLDSDVMVYSRFEELEAVLDGQQLLPTARIVVTPYQLQDEPSRSGVQENTFRTLIRGPFNFGFLGIRRSQVSIDFLRWWSSKLQTLCYLEWRTKGLFVDQKWAFLGMSFFDMTVLREPGYNVANWNVSARRVIRDGRNGCLVDGKPLRFMHFSDMDFDRDLYYFKRFLDISSPVFGLRDQYKESIDSLGHWEFSQLPWTYDKFSSGAQIGQEARLIYRNNPQLQQVFSNPFAESASRFYSTLGLDLRPDE
jgi:hypothetical protein